MDAEHRISDIQLKWLIKKSRATIMVEKPAADDDWIKNGKHKYDQRGFVFMCVWVCVSMYVCVCVMNVQL